MRKMAISLLMSVLVIVLSSCTVLGLVAEHKLKYNDSPAPLAGAVGYPATSAKLNTKSPAEIGLDLDIAVASKVVATLAPAKVPLEFRDVPECADDKVKVCSALNGCKCEVKRSNKKP